MTKTLLTLGLAVSTVLATPAFADYKVTSEAWNIISSMGPVDSKKEKFANEDILRFYYDGKAEKLNGLNGNNVFTVNKNGYIQVNRKGENNGQCVSFVKALANFTKTTGNWKQGAKVNPWSNNFPVGTVIASFKNGSYSGHTGIYMGIKDGKLWILDQNWNPASTGDSGYMTLHPIIFKPNGNLDKENAYSYYVVEWCDNVVSIVLLKKTSVSWSCRCFNLIN